MWRLPSSALHDTARGLVDDLDLAVHYHIVHILLEHGVRLQELDDSVHTLALEGELRHQRVLLLLLLEKRQLRVLDLCYLQTHVREHEEIIVAHG